MIAVGNQGRAVDLAPDADAKHRDAFVADEADEASDGDPHQQRYRLGVNDAVDGLVTGNQGAEQNNEDDGDACKVFDPSIAVRECVCGFAPRQEEGNHSGIAVVASAKLWMVSARRATLPETSTARICSTAVRRG